MLSGIKGTLVILDISWLVVKYLVSSKPRFARFMLRKLNVFNSLGFGSCGYVLLDTLCRQDKV